MNQTEQGSDAGFSNKHGEPMAAKEYDGDRECPYDECENTANWLVETETGTAFFTCERCSRQNRIWVCENELIDADVSQSTIERVENEIGEAL